MNTTTWVRQPDSDARLRALKYKSASCTDGCQTYASPHTNMSRPYSCCRLQGHGYVTLWVSEHVMCREWIQTRSTALPYTVFFGHTKGPACRKHSLCYTLSTSVSRYAYVYHLPPALSSLYTISTCRLEDRWHTLTGLWHTLSSLASLGRPHSAHSQQLLQRPDPPAPVCDHSRDSSSQC